MTTEKLTESIELEDYCLLKGYSIVYNRWVDAVVLSRDGIGLQVQGGSFRREGFGGRKGYSYWTIL